MKDRSLYVLCVVPILLIAIDLILQCYDGSFAVMYGTGVMRLFEVAAFFLTPPLCLIFSVVGLTKALRRKRLWISITCATELLAAIAGMGYLIHLISVF